MENIGRILPGYKEGQTMKNTKEKEGNKMEGTFEHMTHACLGAREPFLILLTNFKLSL